MKSFFIKILLKFVPEGPIDNKLALVSDNGLAPNTFSEPMLTQFTDAYM